MELQGLQALLSGLAARFDDIVARARLADRCRRAGGGGRSSERLRAP
jgi:hypothetical protein